MDSNRWEEHKNNIETQLSRLESMFEENPRYLEKIRNLFSTNGIIFYSRDFGIPLKSGEEAHEHVGLNSHSNFSESTNFVLHFSAKKPSNDMLQCLDAMGISREQSLDVKHGHGNVIEMRSNRIGILKIEKLLQRHGGKLKHYEAYSCSCYGSKEVDDQYYNFCEDVCEAYKNKG
ncbi:hypothetical protein V6N11_071416 [Hibiscus sabdariffa]|uniref:Uncharacterized protein n=1 Tax=Hibiscus sabdariffa TaxID=183260 RepID=A0ABR2U004_9ROSI